MSLRRFLVEDDGATAVEYALLASVFVLLAMAGWRAVGEAASKMYLHISDEITASIQ